MEPESITPEVEQKSLLHQATPVSKYLAMALFVALPFIGGWVGYTYAPEKIVEVERVVEVVTHLEENDSFTKVPIQLKNALEISPGDSVAFSGAAYYLLTDLEPRDVTVSVNRGYGNISFDEYFSSSSSTNLITLGLNNEDMEIGKIYYLGDGLFKGVNVIYSPGFVKFSAEELAGEHYIKEYKLDGDSLIVGGRQYPNIVE